MANTLEPNQTPNYKGINIEEIFHTMLSRLAEKEHRSKSAQVEYLIEKAYVETLANLETATTQVSQ